MEKDSGNRRESNTRKSVNWLESQPNFKRFETQRRPDQSSATRMESVGLGSVVLDTGGLARYEPFQANLAFESR